MEKIPWWIEFNVTHVLESVATTTTTTQLYYVMIEIRYMKKLQYLHLKLRHLFYTFPESDMNNRYHVYFLKNLNADIFMIFETLRDSLGHALVNKQKKQMSEMKINPYIFHC